MNMAVELEDASLSLGAYVKMIKRRKKEVLVPGLVTLIITVLVAVLWPPTYRSSATILIEEQEIPKDLVQSTVTSFADQQIEVINQRIMTLKNIMQLIDKYSLYTEEELQRESKTRIAKEFQGKVNLETISADVKDPRSGRATTATIAFTLSYDHSSPSKAQKVTNELVSLYLNENLRFRSEKTLNASAFLASEADALSKRLNETDARIAEFKKKNEGALPGSYSYNLSVVDRTNREIQDNKFRINNLEQRKQEAENKLIQLNPYAPTVLASGQRVLNDRERLKALELEYRRKAAIYTSGHPDIMRLVREIDVLRGEAGAGVRAKDKARLLKKESEILAEVKQKYTDDHPQVINQQRVVDELKPELGLVPADRLAEESKADDPSYLMMETQIKSAETEIKYLKEKNIELAEKVETHSGYIMAAPTVEQEFQLIERERANALAKFQEIKSKQLGAELAQNLEQDRKGDRFTLIQPPYLPDRPISPNRYAVLFLGVVLAAALGLGYAVLMESTDNSIRGAKKLEEIVGFAPLMIIPYIHTEEEIKTVDRRLYIIIGSVVVAGIIFIALVHFLYKPLDVLWFLLQRKIGIS